ncbi:MAG: thiamine pyrophosphate-dependent dehydrogenase E1 component subunit alpha [Candidatus Omnitrophota bacterium]
MKKNELSLSLYRKMYLIRRAEEKICAHYGEDEIKNPVHLSIGEEAIAAGVCHALGRDDKIFGTYRAHGHYLARTGDTDKFFGELFGKVTGIVKGKAGSMHLSAPGAGLMGTSAIVGSAIPLAVGAAFADRQMKHASRCTAAFFGDGAIDEGVFWESVNAASLMKLPVLFVCEDNGFAVHTPASARHGYRSIGDIVSKFDCEVLKSSTTDVELVYRLTKKAIAFMKRNRRPCFLHLRYYRYMEHVGVNQDFNAGYRPKKEFDRWRRKDPVLLQRKRILRKGVREERVLALEKKIDDQIKRSFQKARKALFPASCELFTGVYG